MKKKYIPFVIENKRIKIKVCFLVKKQKNKDLFIKINKYKLIYILYKNSVNSFFFMEEEVFLEDLNLKI